MKMVVALCLLTGCMALGQEQAVNIEDYSSSEGLAACKPAQWCWEHDPDTPGQSVGSSWLYGPFRRFDIVWKNFGGQRFHIYFNPAHRDAASTTFTTDTWVYFNKLANVNNIEIDLNQAISNGSTVIFGMQCNFPRGVWQYTTNLRDHAHWNDSSISCSRKVWTAGFWHHVIFKYHRDSAGNVSYDSVNFDTQLSDFVGFGNSNFSLGWDVGHQVANFQVDGDGSFSGTTVFLNSFTVHGQ